MDEPIVIIVGGILAILASATTVMVNIHGLVDKERQKRKHGQSTDKADGLADDIDDH